MSRRLFSVTTLAAASLLLAPAAHAEGDDGAQGSVLVKTAPVRRGGAPHTLVAYGMAAPSTLSARSLTLAQPGQVTEVRVTAGEAVRKGQRLIGFANAPTAVAAYRQAETAVAQAQAQREHTARLMAQQLATGDQLAAADKALADARSQFSALRREGAGQAATVLSAPFDGVVATVPVSVGDRPAPGAALVTLNRGSGLQVTLGVEPAWRGQVKVGQPVRLQSLTGGPVVDGRVIRVDAVMNPRSHLVDVDVSVPAGQAIAGQPFKGEIAAGRTDGWLVPHAAVRVEDGKAFVFQAAGGKARRVDVQLAQAGRDQDVVQGPLDPARPLIVVGGYQLDDGDAVRLR